MRRIGFLLAGLFLALLSLAFAAGQVLSDPAPRTVGPPPADLQAQPVTLAGSSGGSIAGWFARGKPGFGGVLLLHGLKGDRRQMLGRSRFLHALGYSVLLIDLPAHGESTGDRITFGYREAEGARAGLRFLEKTLPGEKTAVVGASLGAASFMLADVQPQPDAVVLEMMYPTIEEAIADRLRIKMGEYGTYLSPLLLAQIPLRFGISPAQLHPIDHLKSLRAPVLIVAGREDQRTTLAETMRIFEKAAQPKELLLVDGAEHIDLYKFSPKLYERRVSAFLAKYLSKTVAAN